MHVSCHFLEPCKTAYLFFLLFCYWCHHHCRKGGTPSSRGSSRLWSYRCINLDLCLHMLHDLLLPYPTDCPDLIILPLRMDNTQSVSSQLVQISKRSLQALAMVHDIEDSARFRKIHIGEKGTGIATAWRIVLLNRNTGKRIAIRIHAENGAEVPIGRHDEINEREKKFDGRKIRTTFCTSHERQRRARDNRGLYYFPWRRHVI